MVDEVVTLLLRLNRRLSLLLLERHTGSHRWAHAALHLTERSELAHRGSAGMLHRRKVLRRKILLRRHLSGRHVHLHDGRVVGNGNVVDHTNVFDVRAAEQDVVVDGRLRHDGIGSLPIFGSERSHCIPTTS